MKYQILTMKQVLKEIGVDINKSMHYLDKLVEDYIYQAKSFNNEVYNGNITLSNIVFRGNVLKDNNDILKHAYSLIIKDKSTTNNDHNELCLCFHEIQEFTRYNELGIRIATPRCAALILKLYELNQLKPYTNRDGRQHDVHDEIYDYIHQGYDYFEYAYMNDLEVNDSIEFETWLGAKVSFRKRDIWTIEEIVSCYALKDHPEEFSVLFLTSKSAHCVNKRHKVISCTGIYRGCKINVNYCLSCKAFFISRNDYIEYRKIYGKNLLNGAIATKDDEPLVEKLSQITNMFSASTESILYKNGYNVDKVNGLTDEQRHIILARIMNSRILPKAEILKHINMLINMSKNLLERTEAVYKWSIDYDYVRDYNIDSQMQINITEIIEK